MAERTRRLKHPSEGKQERYIQPSILLGLYQAPSYGYELIQNLQTFGFLEGQAPPGMIYRHLRQLEEDSLVSSEWKTADPGPAKRVYRITPDGKEVLAIWIDFMDHQARNLTAFIARYRTAKKQRPSAPAKGKSEH
jgi:PadR family transcriptional regulator, regulatory protein PadR